VVMGDDEAEQGTLILKPLRSKLDQEILSRQDVQARLGELLGLG